MPRAISAQIESRVTISLDLQDARTLVEAMEQVLNKESAVWVGRVIRDEVAGATCDHFLKQLRKVVG